MFLMTPHRSSYEVSVEGTVEPRTTKIYPNHQPIQLPPINNAKHGDRLLHAHTILTNKITHEYDI
jgi:hypothetical protein